MFTLLITMVNKQPIVLINARDGHSGIPVLHHAIDSKNFETVAVIVRQLNQEKEIEINRAVGIHQWTPLYRAGKISRSSSFPKL